MRLGSKPKPTAQILDRKGRASLESYAALTLKVYIMDDQIELLVEVYTFWRDRLDFWRVLLKGTMDAEVSSELAEKAAAAENEVKRLQDELASHGAMFDTNGGIRWPEGA